MDITFVPFQIEHCPMVWKWIQEDWDSSCDDYAPASFTAFEKYMQVRIDTEELWEVLDGGGPVGLIGYRWISPRSGYLRGLLFPKRVHGTKVTRMAVGMFLQSKFEDGAERIGASYFQRNAKVGKFLEHLGARREGLLVADTIQHGQPINSVMVAFFRDI